ATPRGVPHALRVEQPSQDVVLVDERQAERGRQSAAQRCLAAAGQAPDHDERCYEVPHAPTTVGGISTASACSSASWIRSSSVGRPICASLAMPCFTIAGANVRTTPPSSCAAARSPGGRYAC